MDKYLQEKRTYERFDKETQTFFYFHYDLSTRLDIGGAAPAGETLPAQRQPACTKNISAEGLCFTSLQRLNRGDKIIMEMYIAEGQQPLRLEGEVRWCQFERPGYEEEKGLYNTGVKLLCVNGQSVPETIHYDEAHHIIWSAALDSILGNIRAYAAQRKPAA